MGLRLAACGLAFLSLLPLGAAGASPAEEPLGAGAAPSGGPPAAFAAELSVVEVGFDARLRIRLYQDSTIVSIPASAGTLLLVAADSAAGEGAFFISSDLALELGAHREYRAEFEQVSDLFGETLGGRLRPGEAQIGFILVPAAVDLGRTLAAHPESVVVRYANHRAAFHRANAAEAAFWREAVDPPTLAAGLNAYWEWAMAMAEAPPMNEGERQFLAEHLFPAQGHLLAEERLSAEALRNAILRVGERRLLEGPASQRVVPRYPAAARQLGVGGLVVALAYVDGDGKVADATVLASNTAHMLNLSALQAAMEWRFPRQRGEGGAYADGWRLLPFQFKLVEAPQADTAASRPGDYEPPRIVKPVEPEYPEQARKRRIEGTVIYRATIGPNGKLLEARLEAGADPLLEKAALEALERTLFVPATLAGRPVQGQVSVPFTFGAPKERKNR